MQPLAAATMISACKAPGTRKRQEDARSAVMSLPLDEVAEGEVDLADGDVVLTSDGTETLSDDEVATICGDYRSAGGVARRCGAR